MPIRVVIAERHALAREGLKTVLSATQDIIIAGEAGDGTTVVESVRSLGPDILVLDMEMSGRSGEEITSALKAEKPPPGIVALSASDDWPTIKGMLEAGADAIVLKEGDPGAIVAAIREVALGGFYFEREVLKKIVMNCSGRVSAAAGLSEKEKGIVKMIAEGRSTKEIAHDLRLSVKSIEVYRSQLMRKIAADSVAGIVKYAIREGLAKL